MIKPLKRPEMKSANVKVSDEDMLYFSLGIDQTEFILPSHRQDYHTDERAVAFVQAIRAGKDLTGQDFSGINLKGADISGANLSGVNLSGAIFYKTTARNCIFTNADLTEAYLEDVDLEGADLTNVNWANVYARKLNLTNAVVDPDAQKKLTALEYLIEQIEAGKIDLRFLSKQDLLHLDLRRLDLSHVDLEGIDLSSFNLEGVNLRGVYIDPKQLMSLEGLQHYYQEIERLDEKKIKLETLKFAHLKQREMEAYSKKEQLETDKTVYTPKEELKRPPYKDDKIPQQRIKPQEDLSEHKKDTHEPTRIAGKIRQRQFKLKNRI